MRVLILGNRGYIGNALHKYLEKLGHEVFGCDNGLREALSPGSIIPAAYPESENIDITDFEAIKEFIKKTNPDTIVHLAEQPSAPYSMIGPKEAALTQANNIIGTLNVLWAIKEVNPKIHLIKLGTAGEYPDWLYQGRTVPESSRITLGGWEIPLPRYAGSWYHFSKLHDSYNCDYANRIWGIDITDINQSPVWGHYEGTRLDVDEYFGTVVNRFVAQAVSGSPLTVYGEGGQTRGYIYIENSLEAIRLIMENRPKGFQIVNQMTEVMTINDIAEKVKKITGCEINHIENPRMEMEKHEIDYEHNILTKLGLKVIKMDDKLEDFVNTVRKYKDNISIDWNPKTKWK